MEFSCVAEGEVCRSGVLNPDFRSLRRQGSNETSGAER
jgi:hypothetical protein